MADAAEDSVGGGAEGDGEVKVQLEDPGSLRRSEVQTGGAGFPLLYGRGEGSTGCRSRERRGE